MENYGNQAMAMARNFSAMQNNIADREYAADAMMMKAKDNQKEILTKAWADELVKNPNAKMPDKLPLGVQFSAKILATKANTDFVRLDRQRFASELETYNRDMGTALASLDTGKRDLYKEPVLKALSRIRDGNSDWRQEENGKWSYTKNSDGSRNEIDEPDSKWIFNYLNAHRDPKAYLAAKIKETNHVRDYNEKEVSKGGTEYFDPDTGAKGIVYKKMDDNGGFSHQVTIQNPDGTWLELKSPEQQKSFFSTFKNVDDEKALTGISVARGKRRDSAIPKPSDTVKVDGKPMKTTLALRLMNDLGGKIFDKESGKYDLAAAIIAGKKADLSEKEVASVFAQLKNKKTNGSPMEKDAAIKWEKYYNAIYGGGKAPVQKRSWRDYKD
jgi:hypothetical protein